MTNLATNIAGPEPVLVQHHTRRWMVLCAGLLALCLQMMAQILPPAAMQDMMRAAALSADDAQSFAATCLNLAPRNDGQPAKSDNHANCPVCLTLLQAQGFAAVPIDFHGAIAWTYRRLAGVSASLPTQIRVTASFASRAPPAFSQA